MYNAVLPQLLSAIHSNLITNLKVTNVEISTKFDIPEPVGPNIIILLFSKTSFCVVLSSMSEVEVSASGCCGCDVTPPGPKGLPTAICSNSVQQQA